MLIIAAFVFIFSAGLLYLIFSTPRVYNSKDRSLPSAFINHPDCFVRVTDKTNYEAVRQNLSPSHPEYKEQFKNSLELKIYDIRSAMFNFPKDMPLVFRELLSFSNDIYELFCIMETREPGSQEAAYIFKGDIDEHSSSDSNFLCVSSFNFNTLSINTFTKLGILTPDRAKSTIRHFIDEISMQELLDTAHAQGIAIIGETKEQLFQNAYDKGILTKMQVGKKTPVAYKITDRYFDMETEIFDFYCKDIAKNLKEANRTYADRIIEQACRVNMFSKTRPSNRLTARLAALKTATV